MHSAKRARENSSEGDSLESLRASRRAPSLDLFQMAHSNPTDSRAASEATEVVSYSTSSSRASSTVCVEQSKSRSPSIFSKNESTYPLYLSAADHIEAERNEKNILRNLTHPNIGFINTKCSLNDISYPDIPSPHRFLAWFMQICYAVQHLHLYNIAHRDITPSSIFITHNDSATLGSFKLATKLGENCTHIRSFIGISQTHAPEVTPHAPYDERCDLYALGYTFYMMVHRIYLHNITRTPQVDHMVTQVDTLCRALMRKDPEARPTLYETIRDLKILAGNPPIRAFF